MISKKKTDKEIRLIVKCLEPHFEKVEAYRYDPISIRVRVVDKRFEGQSNPDREKEVLPHLSTILPATMDDITLLLLLTPDEAKHFPISHEFDEPSRSIL